MSKTINTAEQKPNRTYTDNDMTYIEYKIVGPNVYGNKGRGFEGTPEYAKAVLDLIAAKYPQNEYKLVSRTITKTIWA